MKTVFVKEIARDLVALGSVPFYLLVLARAVIGKYPLFVYQLAIGAISMGVLCFIIKNSNMHIARSLVIVVFTIMFYNELLYGIFASLIWILLLLSAYYLKKKIVSLFRGIIVGTISSFAGYYGALLFL